MPVDNWDEIRTAYHVARHGTVSGAASALGVHHATVIRHIDALEARLGARLFQRHARGYTPTEAGHDLLNVAQTTDDQFSQLASRIRGRGEEVTGELIVTALPGLSALLVPSLARFQDEHRDLEVRFLTDTRLFRLDYGEAHVAIRAGSVPEEPDNVVQQFYKTCGGFFAAPHYVENHGCPKDEHDLAGHRFVSVDGDPPRGPFAGWLHERVEPGQIVFRTTELAAMRQAILEGIGIGFMSQLEAARYPDLIEVLPPQAEWQSQLWLVTHVDLHRSMKVQTFTNFLKEEAKAWPTPC